MSCAMRFLCCFFLLFGIVEAKDATLSVIIFQARCHSGGKTIFPKVFIGFYSALVSCLVFLSGADLERKEQELVHGRNMFCPQGR